MDGLAVSSTMTSNIIASIRGNRSDDNVVNGEVAYAMTCLVWERLGDGKVVYKVAMLKGKGKGDNKGERGSMETLGANG